MAIKIRLFQRQRKDIKGKWYGKAVSTGLVDTRELARAISHSNSVTESDVYAVIKALVAEMRYQLQSGKTVVVEDLGRFHLTVKSEMVDSPEAYNIKKHVREVKLKFTPTAHRNQTDRTLQRPLTIGTQVERWTI